jgi:hypothetical protein
MVEKRPLTYPLTVNTIGILVDADYTAFLSCPSCGTRDIDLHKLAEKVGRDWNFIGRRWPVKCRCGNCEVEVRISPPDRHRKAK